MVFRAVAEPKHTLLRRVWKDRFDSRAAPVLVVILHNDKATICGPAGERAPIRHLEPHQAERLCSHALAEPDGHAALSFLQNALPTLETDLPGIRNEGMLSNHELVRGALLRPDWTQAQASGVPALGAVGDELLQKLGFRVDTREGIQCLFPRDTQEPPLAMLLTTDNSPHRPASEFQNTSPVSWALAMAQQRNLPWVVLLQNDRIRLYPVKLGIGVGQRGRTDTWIEFRTRLMREDQAALLWLIISADALTAGGTLLALLDSSRRFAADLAVRLRERIYDRVVPRLATGIARARNLQSHSPDELRLTYAMAITVLFRLLFIAYAEDRDFLPYSRIGSYKQSALKTMAQELDRDIYQTTSDDRLWRKVTRLFEAVRIGDSALGVPAYGGGLFETDPAISRIGAELATINLPDVVFKPILCALLLDETRDLGRPGEGPVDFRSLRVGEFGTIYEGLLESDLAVADVDLTLAKQGKDLIYVPATAKQLVHVTRGTIYLHNRSGARKSSGSYFTPAFAVDYLLDAALVPALKAHAERLAALDTAEATEAFFDIRVADIAMGSGHFLVAAVDVLEQALSAILISRALPGVMTELATLRSAAQKELNKLGLESPLHIDDGDLLRRLIARRCIYGVDLNPLAVDLAKLSVWIHTFVPGLPLSLVDHRLVQGNALVGVATLDEAKRRLTALAGVGLAVEPADMLRSAFPHLARLASISDATLQDVVDARTAYLAARDAVASAELLFDAAIAVALGHVEFRIPANQAIAHLSSAKLPLDLRGTALHAQISVVLEPAKPLHLPTRFPEVFHRARAGFDVIIGNPPWEKLRVASNEFWARHFPGLRGIKGASERDGLIQKLRDSRPDLRKLERDGRAESEILRDAVRMLPGMNTGHPDLFRAFMGRYVQLLVSDGGRYGVVLPGEAFKVKGTGIVREQLDAVARQVDVQMLTNRREWIFRGIHAQKTVALTSVEIGARDNCGCQYHFRPEVHRLDYFLNRNCDNVAQRDAAWLRRYSPELVLPTLPSGSATLSMAVLECMMHAPRIAVHPTLTAKRVYADVETTRDKATYDVAESASDIWPVYGGDSFDLWTPDTGTYYALTTRDKALETLQRKRINSPSTSAYGAMPRAWRYDVRTHPCLEPRIAFRNVTSRANHRTFVVALVPAERILVETAPWVLWLSTRKPIRHEAFLLGVMSSLPADWWMRCFVETHVEGGAFDSLRTRR